MPAKYYVGRETIGWGDILYHHGGLFRSISTTAYECMANPEILLVRCDPKDSTAYGLATSDGDIKQAKSGHTAWMRKNERVLNIKYVAKKIKEADYNTFGGWLCAVYKAVKEFKTRSNLKSKMHADQKNLAAQIDFFDIFANMEDQVREAGFVPTPANKWMQNDGLKTLNEWAIKNKRKEAHFKKGKMGLVVRRTGSRDGIVEICGIQTSKLSELVSVIMDYCKKNP